MAVFIPNPAAPFLLKHSPEMEAATRAVAERIKEKAVQLVPVGTAEEVHTGEVGALKASIHTERGSGGSSLVIVGTNYWVYPEYGTMYQDPQSFFRAALESERTSSIIASALASTAVGTLAKQIGKFL